MAKDLTVQRELSPEAFLVVAAALTSVAPVASAAPALPLSTPPLGAFVRPHNGRPTIFVNGAPVTPHFYALTHTYKARWSWEEPKQRCLREMYDAGVRLYQCDMYFEDIWHDDTSALDIDLVRRQIGGILSACPDAAVVLRIHVNTPLWWNAAHPEECTEFADGPTDWKKTGSESSHEVGDLERSPRPSFASRRWLTDSGRRLEELCTRLAATPEGDRVIGFHVCGGIFGEWHYWASVTHDPDTGPAMTREFRAWLKARYGTRRTLCSAWSDTAWSFENATIPDTAERMQADMGFFFDPLKRRRVMDYFTFQHETAATAIEHFCRIVKRTWPRPTLVGVFYGYYHMMFCRQAVAGHLQIERILNCPDIDYLSAPQSYWGSMREAGGSGNPRGVVESVNLHGKLWLDEVDNGFQRTGPDDTVFVPVVRRSSMYPLLRGNGFWYYDFGIASGQGWWQTPRIMANVAEDDRFFRQLTSRPHTPAADVLFVWDTDVFFGMKDGWNPVSFMQIDQATEDALRSGAVIDHMYTFDIGRVDLERYRAVVVANPYRLTPAQRASLTRALNGGSRTVIWNYLPGLSDGRALSLRTVERTTGFALARRTCPDKPAVSVSMTGKRFAFEAAVEPFAVISDDRAEPLGVLEQSGECVVARKAHRTYTTVHSTLPLMGSDNFRALFRHAGCHIYNEQNDFTYATMDHVLLHTSSGGPRTIPLRSGTRVEVALDGPSTVLIDARTGAVLMR